METGDLIQFAAQLGVGGLLAAFMFLVAWRYVTKQVEEQKEDKKILMDLVSAVMVIVTKNTASTDSNTAAVNELRRELTEHRTALERTTERTPERRERGR